MKSRALVLFDIDGTLVRRAGPHHREALVEAVRAITRLDTTTENIPVHGMLDPDILRRMMRDAGASEELIVRQLPAIMRRAQSIYVRRCPDLQDKTCPGVRRLLYSLQRRGIPTGLVTGNLTRIGWKKMERAGLRHYFHCSRTHGHRTCPPAGVDPGRRTCFAHWRRTERYHRSPGERRPLDRRPHRHFDA
ncbi:MAG: hypothetical protein DMG58_23200 [Acidobacteria bacterium]|nr:MAG: hypothetical protein DMG58_23200 [Acidobacteriota bacterium]